MVGGKVASGPVERGSNWLWRLLQIQTEEAQAWCDRAGLPYFETSAKENTNVGEAFVRVVQRALESESAGKDPMSFDLDTYLPQLDEEEDDANLSPPTCCA